MASVHLRALFSIHLLYKYTYKVAIWPEKEGNNESLFLLRTLVHCFVSPIGVRATETG